MKRYISTCHCADREGYITVLNNGVCVGITTQFNSDGAFKGNQAAWLENRFCPQCGAPRKIVDEEESNDDQ